MAPLLLWYLSLFEPYVGSNSGPPSFEANTEQRTEQQEQIVVVKFYLVFISLQLLACEVGAGRFPLGQTTRTDGRTCLKAQVPSGV